MGIIVSHQSAYAYWDRANPKMRGLVPSRMRAVPKTRCTESDAVGASRALRLDEPIHVLVPSDSLRRINKHVHSHVWRKPIDYGDLYLVTESISVVSPEFAYHLLTQEDNIAQSAMLAMEMCGDFSTRWPNVDYVKRRPLTSVAKLRNYFAQHFSEHARSQAILALSWSADNSKSPMESALLLALCLPPRYGGYGIPLPELNPKIEYGETVSAMSQTDYSQGDLVWQKEHLVVEYYGGKDHTGEEGISHDARRANALNYAKYRVIVVTKRQLQSLEDIDNLAKQVCQAIGKRFPKKSPTQRTEQRRLYKTLFPWWRYPDFWERA